MSIKTPKHCSLDAQDNYLFSETTVKAETTSVLSYIKSIEKRFSDDDVMAVCGYEAGSTGFSFCRELQKKNISCVVMAPSSLPKSPDDKKRKTDKIDARNLALHLAHNTYNAVSFVSEIGDFNRFEKPVILQVISGCVRAFIQAGYQVKALV